MRSSISIVTHLYNSANHDDYYIDLFLEWFYHYVDSCDYYKSKNILKQLLNYMRRLGINIDVKKYIEVFEEDSKINYIVCRARK